MDYSTKAKIFTVVSPGITQNFMQSP